MGDEVPHMGVVHGALGFGFPGGKGGFIVREHPDNVDLGDIAENVGLRVNQFAPEDKVQALGHECLHIVVRS